VEGAEFRFAPRQRPRGVVADAAAHQFIQRAVQPDGHAGPLHQRRRLGLGERPPAQRHHAAAPAGHVAELLQLQQAEMRFAVAAEDLHHRQPGDGLHQVIQVHGLGGDPARQLHGHAGLAGAHESHQVDVARGWQPHGSVLPRMLRRGRRR